MIELLIKTFDKLEYANDFYKKGAMLFSRASHFKDVDDNNVRKDNNEGHVIDKKRIKIPNNVNHFYIGDGGKKYFVDWKAVKKAYPDINNCNEPIELKIEYVANVLIYSMTYVCSKTRNIDDVLNESAKFGEYSVVVYDVRDFIERIKQLPTRQAGLVQYVDDKGKDIFIKPTRYKNEQEFRIMLNNDNNVDREIFHIGQIKAFVCSSRSLPTIKNML